VIDGYHETRLSKDNKRETLWLVLSEYLQPYVARTDTVLDFGAGYCGFINNIKADKKIAYDIWPGISEYCSSDVQPLIGDELSYDTLSDIDHGSLDVVFASNIFEHFEVEQLSLIFDLLSDKLSGKGKLIVIQPNYYYAYRQYFDDYTHKSIWTHNSFSDFVTTKGFKIIDMQPKFMPLTVKSRLPVHKLLIKLYLASPIKPLSGQMLFVCQKSEPDG